MIEVSLKKLMFMAKNGLNCQMTVLRWIGLEKEFRNQGSIEEFVKHKMTLFWTLILEDKNQKSPTIKSDLNGFWTTKMIDRLLIFKWAKI